MGRAWSFTDFGWNTLWDSVHHDWLPAPLIYTERMTDEHEYRAEKQRVLDRLRTLNDLELRSIVDALGGPDIRIEVQGYDGQDMEDPEGCIRVLGARRAGLAAVVVQRPGETIWHSGGYDLAECEVPELAAVVVAALPEMPAGELGEVVVPGASAEDVDYEYGLSPVYIGDDSAAQRYRAFTRAGFDTVGRLDIVQARSKFGVRGTTRHRLEWRDRRGDGRYAILPGDPAIAKPVDARGLVDLINDRIAAIVTAIRDESL
ncbi:ESX secretion-associated protein EspG [Nocardia sp. NEAU-G5]|uniref:ESX secretion-associated protein EspG n=1 Tax=Nocardia albiluteola TaxID=2842303 RepID=A0ABS6BBT2_9NOCA|nr:ESX secretion-associated protein EspG [Nocardia albiluteola]MBU3067730.1 ESX secretion-associated protein EspG [Nocardia albiluteola]